MFYFHKVAYVQYLGEVDIFHTWVKIYSSLQQCKNIKIDRDFPKLLSQCTATFLWFTVYNWPVFGSSVLWHLLLFLILSK